MYDANRAIYFLVVAMLISFLSCGKSSNPTSNSPPPAPTKSGKLEITVSGLSSNQTANISITGPQDSTITCSGYTIFDSVAVGFYTIKTNFIIDANGDTIFAVIQNQTAIVEENKTASVNVIYQAQLFGSLNITFAGLSGGINGFVKLVKTDYTFIQNITDSTQIDSLLIGTYLLICSNVLGPNDQEFNPIVDTILANISDGNLTNITVEYKSGFYYKIYGNINVSTSVGASLDGSPFDESNSSYGSGTPPGFINDGCKLILTDIESGYSKSSTASAGGGSASASQSLSFQRSANIVTLITTATVNAPTPGSSSFGIISADAQGTTYPFVLQFDNPDRDSVEVIVSWDASGSASGGGTDNSRAGSTVQAALYIHTSTCYTTLFTTSVPYSFSAFENSLHTDDNMPPSGQSSVKFNSSSYLVGFDLMTRSFANSFQQAIGNSLDGSGSGSCNLSVTVTVSIRRF